MPLRVQIKSVSALLLVHVAEIRVMVIVVVLIVEEFAVLISGTAALEDTLVILMVKRALDKVH